MDRRQFVLGVSLIGVGTAVFVVLAATGSLRHPQAAAEHTQPVEFLAIGGGFLLVTLGVLATFLAYVDLAAGDAEPP